MEGEDSVIVGGGYLVGSAIRSKVPHGRPYMMSAYLWLAAATGVY